MVMLLIYMQVMSISQMVRHLFLL